MTTGTVAAYRATILASTVLAVLAARPALAQTSDPSASAASDAAEEIVVTARYADRETRTDTALKSPLPLHEVPLNVNVLTNELLRDINAEEIGDALQFVSSVDRGNFAGIYDFFSIRGQQVDQVNGYRLDGNAYINFISPDFTALEAIEVLKGPVSTLYGRGTGGGVINFVSKKPTDELFAEAQLEAGSFDRRRGIVDVSIPVSDTLGIRVAGSVTDTESFTRGVDENKGALYAVARWQPSEATDVLFQYTYQKNNGVSWFGLPVRELADGSLEVPDDLPRRTFVGADWNRYRLEFENANVQVSQELSDILTFNVRGSYTYLDRLNELARSGSLLDAANNFDLVGERDVSDGYDSYSGEANLLAEFDSGAGKATALLGVDYSKTLLDFNGNYDAPLVIRKSILDPTTAYARPDLASTFFGGEDYKAYGVYLQGTIEPVEGLTLLGGMRYDWFDYIFEPVGDVPFAYKSEEFTYRLGATYEFSPGASIYAGYSTGFNPSFSLDSVTGAPLDDETATNYEVGVKGDLFDKRVYLSSALFYTKRKNVPVPNPNQTGNQPDLVSAGEQVFKGIEFDVASTPVPGFDILASFSVLDAEDQNNLTPARAPDWTGSFFTSYQIQSGPLENFGAAIGARFISDRPGIGDNSFELKSYDEWQAQVFYRTDKLRLQVAVENLFNDKSIVTSDGFNTFNGLFFNAPRHVVFSAAIRY